MRCTKRDLSLQDLLSRASTPGSSRTQDDNSGLSLNRPCIEITTYLGSLDRLGSTVEKRPGSLAFANTRGKRPRFNVLGDATDSSDSKPDPCGHWRSSPLPSVIFHICPSTSRTRSRLSRCSTPCAKNELVSAIVPRTWSSRLGRQKIRNDRAIAICLYLWVGQALVLTGISRSWLGRSHEIRNIAFSRESQGKSASTQNC